MITQIKRSGNVLKVTEESGELGRNYNVLIPDHLREEKAYIRKGKLYAGQYRYNEETGTWDKVNKILLLLLKIWNAITEVFKK